MVTSTITFGCASAGRRRSACPSRLRFHSRIAATNKAAIECVGFDDSGAIELFQRLARPERLLEVVHGPRMRANRKVLSIAIAQYPDRADHEPDHHRFDEPVRLPEQAEQREIGRIRARIGRSVGSMGTLSVADNGRAGRRREDQKGDGKRSSARPNPKCRRISSCPPPAGVRIPRQHVQTRALAAPSDLNDALTGADCG